MSRLEHTLTNDVLFKMFFRDYPDLRKRLVAEMLDIPLESIEECTVINPEMPPDAMREKFCRLDIAMRVEGRLVNLEVQVDDEGDYPERSLFHWARLFSSGLPAGGDYSDLPPTIAINIVAFPLFGCAEFYSEFRPLEVKRHELLTDRMRVCYFELTKLPEVVDGSDELKLWLALFNAKTEEDLIKLQNIGGTVMTQAVAAYRHVSASGEFRELERLRAIARHNEASALAHAERKGREEGWKKGSEEGQQEGWRKGIEEERKKNAKAMKDEGIDIATIAKITGLEVDDIRKL
jgi:predicted transposase/invertase (TIGR01784 family)